MRRVPPPFLPLPQGGVEGGGGRCLGLSLLAVSLACVLLAAVLSVPGRGCRARGRRVCQLAARVLTLTMRWG